MNNRRYYHEIFMTSRKFYHEIFILEQNSRDQESFCHKSLELYGINYGVLIWCTIIVVYIPFKQ